MGEGYLELTEEERERLIGELKRALEGTRGIVFAYLHGGFVERRFFRDVEVAVWLEDPSEAARVEVDLSPSSRRGWGFRWTYASSTVLPCPSGTTSSQRESSSSPGTSA